MLDLLLLHLCKDGEQQIHRYGSKDIGLPMRFSAYTSPKALHINANVLALVYLTGLTSVRETFPIKTAARLRIFWHYLGDRSPFMLALRIRRSIAHCRRSRLFAAPMQCRSCEKAFNAYPSDDGEARKQYNASELVR